MSSAQIIPAQDDINAQLKRMLASKRFSTASNQKDFLVLVVNRALKGKKSPESIIARELFPKFIKDESTDVRVTASNLRKALAKYYAREGHEDLVIIALPEPPSDRSVKLPAGEAYTPVFSYNPNHAAAREFKLGEYYNKRGMISDHPHAIAHFRKVVDLTPNHVGAIVGLAEVLCAAFTLGVSLGFSEERRSKWLSEADNFIEKAVRLAPNFWRVHVAKGHLLMCRNEVAPAEAEFNIARSLDRNSTESCLSFFRFLCETGKSQESVRMRKSYLDTHVDDVLAHVVYGTALSVAGHLEEAEQVLKNALQMDQSCFAVHFELALFYSKQNRAAEATHHAQCLEPLVDQATFEMIQRWISNRLLHAKTTSP